MYNNCDKFLLVEGAFLLREAGCDNAEILLLVHGLGHEAADIWEPFVAGLVLEKTSHVPMDPDLILASAAAREKFLAGDSTRIAALALVQSDFSLLIVTDSRGGFLVVISENYSLTIVLVC